MILFNNTIIISSFLCSTCFLIYRIMKKYIIFSLILFAFCIVHAHVVLPKVITNNMVLQRGKPVTIWGTALANEKVSVYFDGQTKTSVADHTGKWLVKLNPMETSAITARFFTSEQLGPSGVSLGHSFPMCVPCRSRALKCGCFLLNGEITRLKWEMVESISRLV